MRATLFFVLLSGCLLAGSEHGSGGDGGNGSGSGSGSGSGVMCNDDSAFESNDALSSAFDTGIGTQTSSVSFVGLAICPAGDLDNYRIDLLDGGSLQLNINWDFGFPALELSLLNSSGAAILTGIPNGDGVSATLCAASLPPGQYFAQVAGSSTTVKNNYAFFADQLPSCN